MEGLRAFMAVLGEQDVGIFVSVSEASRAMQNQKLEPKKHGNLLLWIWSS